MDNQSYFDVIHTMIGRSIRRLMGVGDENKYSHAACHVNDKVDMVGSDVVPGGESIKHVVDSVIKIDPASMKKVSICLSGENRPDVFYKNSAGKVIVVLSAEIVKKLENGQSVIINPCDDEDDVGVI
jgi:hypothetical protein